MKPLGKPVNNLVKSCEDVTATCVIWDGPNISAECLGIQIYQGDSIVPILYNTFKNFCQLLEKVDLSTVDSSCIIDLASPPDTLAELINLINEKLCDNDIRIKREENKAYATNIAGLPFCLQIKSDTITITKLPLEEQLVVVSNTLCQELEDLENLQTQLDPTGPIYTQLDELAVLIDNQCNPVIPQVTQLCLSSNPVIEIVSATILSPNLVSYITSIEHGFEAGTIVNVFNINPDIYNVTQEPVILPVVDDPFAFIISYPNGFPSGTPLPSLSLGASVTIATSISVEQAYEVLEKAFCSFKNFTGSPSDLQIAIARDCPNLGDLPSLSSSGIMRDLYGWIDGPINVGQSVNNLWITVCDLRTAIRKILRTCCSDTPCLSFDIGYNLNFDPNNQFVEVIFQELYFGPTPVVPPGPPPVNWMSGITNLARTSTYNQGVPPYPAWLDQSATSDFFDISTVKITLNDGSASYTQDTGMNIMEWMTMVPFGYQFNYPSGYDLQAPFKTIKVEFSYSYVLKITNVQLNIPSPGKITYTTATKHPYVVGSRVDIMNVNPSAYDYMDMQITAVPSVYDFVITTPTVPAPGPYVIGGNVIQSSATRDCTECGCCCTYSITNGLY